MTINKDLEDKMWSERMREMVNTHVSSTLKYATLVLCILMLAIVFWLMNLIGKI